MNRSRLFGTAILAGLLFVWPTLSDADTLFKGESALAIGHGTKKGNKLNWTDCGGKNPKVYDAPPYWVDASSNCELSVDSFGLKSLQGAEGQKTPPEGIWTRVSIRNAAFLKKLFPDAKPGDTVLFYKGKDSIKLKWGDETRELKTTTVNP
jgi:hypothetical protein